MDFCRLCASSTKKPLIPILENNPLNIREKIQKLLNIKVTTDSKLPSSLCLDCLTKLNQFNEFYSTSTESQCVLEIIFGKDEVKEEPALPVPETSCQPDSSKEQIYIIEEFTTEINFDQIEDSVDESQLIQQTPKKKFDRFDCYLCDKQFPGNLKFVQHFTEDHPEAEVRYTCFVCQAFVLKYRSYTRHLESHSQKRFACDKCDKSFSQKITLVQHLNSHSQIKTYQCSDCDLNFKQNSSLFKHRRQKHSNGVIQCDECQKNFVNNETLLQHLRSKHKAEMNISCEICAKKFASRSALIYHKSSQHNDNNDKSRCEICSRSFKTAIILKRHLKKIHNQT